MTDDIEEIEEDDGDFDGEICPQCDERSYDGNICHNCGLKDI